MRLLERLGIAVGAVRAFSRRPSGGDDERERIVPTGPPQPTAELVVIGLLLLAALFGAGFMVVYSFNSLTGQTQLLGLALGGGLVLVGIALVVIGHNLVVTEELDEEYPGEHPSEQVAISQIVTESGSRFTRKRLVLGAGGLAAGALGLAALTPALSMGTWFHTASLYRTPWRRGRRLVDRTGRPFLADDIAQGTFYTAYAEGASIDDIASPLVVVRLDPAALQLPANRANWAPQGILAYSKICTHAGCALALYRTALFPPASPQPPALVCPCHYSTFNPADGGSVIFGPAGRNLPQLPLLIDAAGQLRAAGNFSGPVGPSFAGVRTGKVTS
jgi:ubiquinol-cytochrome c reductase iron-sulfur subunit